MPNRSLLSGIPARDGLTVIPVLVEGASMPMPASLPQSLRVLPQINAVEVRNDPDFTRDIERVVEVLERIFAQRRRSPTWYAST